AKSSWSHQQLSLQIKEEQMRRIYLAITDGAPPMNNGIISVPIKRGEVGIKRIVEAGGQEALTHYRVIQKTEHAALLLLR
ncbi:MAG TPA: RluA family pseudouridine synthase, partial [Firmicutes bacterium]|nr:RluA family pseudouridine synthase [Bacillota bacterium]